MTTFTYRRKMQIEWGHCDPAGIVFNSRFFEFFDHSTWLLMEAALEHRLTINGELAVEGGESRVWACMDKDNPKKIAVRPIPAEVIARFG